MHGGATRQRPSSTLSQRMRYPFSLLRFSFPSASHPLSWPPDLGRLRSFGFSSASRSLRWSLALRESLNPGTNGSVARRLGRAGVSGQYSVVPGSRRSLASLRDSPSTTFSTLTHPLRWASPWARPYAESPAASSTAGAVPAKPRLSILRGSPADMGDFAAAPNHRMKLTRLRASVFAGTDPLPCPVGLVRPPPRPAAYAASLGGQLRSYQEAECSTS